MLMKYRFSLNSRLIYGETINDSLHTFCGESIRPRTDKLLKLRQITALQLLSSFRNERALMPVIEKSVQ